jgi:hypothetical protein
MHRTTLAATGATRAAKEFAHHARRRYTFGNRVAVATVVARDKVVRV